MKKTLFRQISMILSIILFLSVTSTFIAHGDTTKSENSYSNTSVEINEYLLAKELSELSINQLNKMGLNENEIDTIKDYRNHYIKHIDFLNTLNDKSLIENGYSKNEINIIRNFKGSEKELLALGATMTFSAYTSNFNYDGTYTRGTLGYNWSWNGIPAYKMQDMIAASWNTWIIVSNTSYVYYYNTNSGSFYSTVTPTYVTKGYNGAGHKFRVGISDNYYYAKSGGGTFTLKSDVQAKKDFYYSIAYGHSQLLATIDFSISVYGPSVSLSFSSGVVTSGSKTGSRIAN